MCFEHPGLRWASQQSGRFDWDLRPGAAAHLTPVPAWAMNALTYKTGEGDRTGHLPSCFLRSKRGTEHNSLAAPRWAHDITSERFENILEHPPHRQVHKKTGTTHALPTSCEVAAAFNSNGKPAGVLHEFLDRTAAFDRSAARLPGVEGLRQTTPAVPMESK